MKTETTLSYNAALEAFKGAARKKAVEICEDHYNATHANSLETAFYANNREAYDAIRLRLPRDLFDAAGTSGLCEFLFDDRGLDLDERGEEDSGLTEEDAEEQGETWAEYECDDKTWIEELAADDLIYHIEGSDKTITREEIEAAVDALGDYLIDRDNAGETVALYLFEDGSYEVADASRSFSEFYVRTTEHEVGDIEDWDEYLLGEWKRESFNCENSVSDELASQLEIGRPSED